MEFIVSCIHYTYYAGIAVCRNLNLLIFFTVFCFWKIHVPSLFHDIMLPSTINNGLLIQFKGTNGCLISQIIFKTIIFVFFFFFLGFHISSYFFGLKYLDLHIRVDDLSDNDDQLPKLPIGILTCRTLVSLNLRRFQVKGIDFSSIGFGFPSLNVLQLRDMVFHEVRDFMLLLAGCPNLEHLGAEDIHFHCEEVDYLTIQEFKSLSSPKLTTVDITQWWASWFPVKALPNSKYMCTDTFMLSTKDHKLYKIYEVRFILNIMHCYFNLYNTDISYLRCVIVQPHWCQHVMSCWCPTLPVFNDSFFSNH